MQDWGLLDVGDEPPKGVLFHATGAVTDPLNLYKEVHNVSNPLNSKSMVVFLKVAESPGLDALKTCADSIHLMDPAHLPQGEILWTSQVYIMEVIRALCEKNFVDPKCSLSTIKERCCHMADTNITFMSKAKVFNDLNWMAEHSSSNDTKGLGI
ncbi:hypothetical protein F4806DRAFT_492533 [Annulohypoxylon nitens]|nr:hypothetical protein F4806DRAFT_492533 [Annulohypoxylon nitens]